MMHIDKLMGGIVRDAEQSTPGLPADPAELRTYIQQLFSEATINFNQITGTPTTNTELKTYIQNLINNITINQIAAGDQITNDIKQYCNTLVENLTVTFNQITGTPSINTEFKTYIDNLITELTVSLTEIITAPVLTTEIKNYIDNLGDVLLTTLQQFVIDQSVSTEVKNYIDSRLTTIQNNLTLISEQNETLVTQIQNLTTKVTEISLHITEGDTITQEYKDYITNRFTTIEQELITIAGDSYITEVTEQYIDARLTEVTNILKQFVTNTVNEDLRKYIDEITNVSVTTNQATRLISGTIEWIENLDFQVSPLVYQILNNRAESTETLVTIPANVSANPMFAVIYGDLSGNVSFIQGTPAPAPAVPTVNARTQIHLLTVYIPANGTAPATDPGGETTEIAGEVIFDEGTEWTPAKTEETNVAIDLEATTEPAKGTKHISLLIAGGTGLYSKADLITSPGVQDEKTIALTAGMSPSFQMAVSDIFPDHKTDSTAALIRHLVYYRIAKRFNIIARLITEEDATEYRIICQSFTNETFTNSETGLSVEIPALITFSLSGQTIPLGNYILVVSGFIRNDQQYNATLTPNTEPATAEVSFTRAEAIDANGGNIALSIKTGAAWLNNSGLLFDLYNAARKIGSLLMSPANLYGFNPENVTDYQRVTLPVSAFNPLSDQITKLVISPVNAWTNRTVLFLDNISLQTGGQLVKETDIYLKAASFNAETKVLTLIRTCEKEEINVPIPYPAAQIPANYTQETTTAPDYIANKPTLGTMSAKTFWSGTAAAYAAIGTKDANTIYFIEE